MGWLKRKIEAYKAAKEQKKLGNGYVKRALERREENWGKTRKERKQARKQQTTQRATDFSETAVQLTPVKGAEEPIEVADLAVASPYIIEKQEVHELVEEVVREDVVRKHATKTVKRADGTTETVNIEKERQRQIDLANHQYEETVQALGIQEDNRQNVRGFNQALTTVLSRQIVTTQEEAEEKATTLKVVSDTIDSLGLANDSLNKYSKFAEVPVSTLVIFDLANAGAIPSFAEVDELKELRKIKASKRTPEQQTRLEELYGKIVENRAKIQDESMQEIFDEFVGGKVTQNKNGNYSVRRITDPVRAKRSEELQKVLEPVSKAVSNPTVVRAMRAPKPVSEMQQQHTEVLSSSLEAARQTRDTAIAEAEAQAERDIQAVLSGKTTNESGEPVGLDENYESDLDKTVKVAAQAENRTVKQINTRVAKTYQEALKITMHRIEDDVIGRLTETYSEKFKALSGSYKTYTKPAEPVKIDGLKIDADIMSGLTYGKVKAKTFEYDERGKLAESKRPYVYMKRYGDEVSKISELLVKIDGKQRRVEKLLGPDGEPKPGFEKAVETLRNDILASQKQIDTLRSSIEVQEEIRQVDYLLQQCKISAIVSATDIQEQKLNDLKDKRTKADNAIKAAQRELKDLPKDERDLRSALAKNQKTADEAQIDLLNEQIGTQNNLYFRIIRPYREEAFKLYEARLREGSEFTVNGQPLSEAQIQAKLADFRKKHKGTTTTEEIIADMKRECREATVKAAVAEAAKGDREAAAEDAQIIADAIDAQINAKFRKLFTAEDQAQLDEIRNNINELQQQRDALQHGETHVDLSEKIETLNIKGVEVKYNLNSEQGIADYIAARRLQAEATIATNQYYLDAEYDQEVEKVNANCAQAVRFAKAQDISNRFATVNSAIEALRDVQSGMDSDSAEHKKIEDKIADAEATRQQIAAEAEKAGLEVQYGTKIVDGKKVADESVIVGFKVKVENVEEATDVVEEEEEMEDEAVHVDEVVDEADVEAEREPTVYDEILDNQHVIAELAPALKKGAKKPKEVQRAVRIAKQYFEHIEKPVPTEVVGANQVCEKLVDGVRKEDLQSGAAAVRTAQTIANDQVRKIREQLYADGATADDYAKGMVEAAKAANPKLSKKEEQQLYSQAKGDYEKFVQEKEALAEREENPEAKARAEMAERQQVIESSVEAAKVTKFGAEAALKRLGKIEGKVAQAALADALKTQQTVLGATTTTATQTGGMGRN